MTEIRRRPRKPDDRSGPRTRHAIRRIGQVLRYDDGLTAAAATGVFLAGATWSIHGWALPSTMDQVTTLVAAAGKVGLLLSLVAVLALVPRVLAWRVLRGRVGDEWRRIDANGSSPDLTSKQWWRVGVGREAGE